MKQRNKNKNYIFASFDVHIFLKEIRESGSDTTISTDDDGDGINETILERSVAQGDEVLS